MFLVLKFPHTEFKAAYLMFQQKKMLRSPPAKKFQKSCRIVYVIRKDPSTYSVMKFGCFYFIITIHSIPGKGPTDVDDAPSPAG